MQEWLICKPECPLRRRKRLHRIFETLWRELSGPVTTVPPRALKRDVCSVIGGNSEVKALRENENLASFVPRTQSACRQRAQWNIRPAGS